MPPPANLNEGIKMQQKQSWTCEQSVLTAWREQLAEAERNPRLKQQLLHRERELLPHFAAHYEQLRVLPRRVRRSLQRKWKQTLAGVALLMALGTGPALAGIINVGGACTLVDAITAANTDAATGGGRAGLGPDTIVLPRGSTQTLTSASDTIYGATGLPVVTTRITIAGNDSAIVRDRRAPGFGIFAVGYGGNLTLQQTTVSGGNSGLDVRDGSAQLFDSTISNNGVGVSGYDSSVPPFNVNIALANSTVSDNSSYGLYGKDTTLG